MDNKIFNDTAIQILLLTAVSFAGIHFYELGYCRYFGIPTEYISFELNKNSYLLFIFFATLYFSSLTIDGLVSGFFSLFKIKNKWLRILLVILFIALIIFSFQYYLRFLTYPEIVVLVFVMFFGFTLIVNIKKPDNDPNSKYSINRFLSQKVGQILGPTLIISAIICAVLFCLGYMSAKLQYSFPTRPDEKTVLLKKYGNNSIFGINEKGKIRLIIIEQNLSKIDTFHITKIK